MGWAVRAGAELALLRGLAKTLASRGYKRCVEVVSGNNGLDLCSTARLISSIRGDFLESWGLVSITAELKLEPKHPKLSGSVDYGDFNVLDKCIESCCG